uniref:Cystein-Rich Protein (CRP) family 2 n=2 Tax=uncultured eukaryote TaxID=100272 RepID=K7ZWD7_9EUKA|nr:Cystein-Rich Protein (CRP) family 2 [uncultured eukaryote]
MATCCCKIPENVKSEACCPPTCCPKSCCPTGSKTETCKSCGCCATTCPCCVSESKQEAGTEAKDIKREGLAPHPQCECASTVLKTPDSRPACGCPLIVVCGCGAECEKCDCKHEDVTKVGCSECPQKQDGGD